MQASTIYVARTPSELAAEAVARISRAAQDAIRQREEFTLALSGGHTPQSTYRLLAEPPAGIDWQHTYVFFVDERMVPSDDPRSNYGAARASLLNQVSIPAENVFAVPTDQPTALQAAAAYAQTVSRFFQRRRLSADVPALPPRFDFMVLGIGADGHIASLFPHSRALSVADELVTWNPPGTLPPAVDRITMTFPVINAARESLFLVRGVDKAGALRSVLEGNPSVEDCPAVGVNPDEGELSWLVDEPAAGLLRQRV